MKSLFQDWHANRGNPKGRLLLVLFRIAHALRFGPRWLLPITIVYGIFYRITIEWILGVELPWKTRIGPGLRIDHGQGLVINDGTILGANCHLRHNTTIGNKLAKEGGRTGCPRIGNSVDIGAGAILLGDISVGDHAVIGAGSVVVKDVPPGAIVAGNPARVLRILT